MKLITRNTGFIIGMSSGFMTECDPLLMLAFIATFMAGMCCAYIHREGLDRKYGHH